MIDERRYRNQLDSALAELERAHSAAELAQVQDTRAQTLLASNAVSRDQADTRKASVTQSNAVVNAARGRGRRGQAQSRIHQGEGADFGPRRPRAGDGRQSRPGRYDVADHPGVAGSGLCLLRQRRTRLSALRRAGPPGRTQRIAQCGARRPRRRAGLSARRHGRLHRSSGRFKHRHHPHPRHPRKMPTAGSRPACSRACSWKAPANPPPC